MTKLEEIYEAILSEMKDHEIADTPENRIAMLSGLRDGWLEDKSDRGLLKTIYITILTNELIILNLKLRFGQH